MRPPLAGLSHTQRSPKQLTDSDMMQEFYQVKAMRRFKARVEESGRSVTRLVKEGEQITVNAQQYRALTRKQAAQSVTPEYIEGASIKDLSGQERRFSSSELKRLNKSDLLMLMDRNTPGHGLSMDNTKRELIAALMG